jgi:hypothetical protein
LADHVLLLHMAPESDLGAIVATGNSLASAALLDALVEVTRVGRGYSWREFFFTHPSIRLAQSAPLSLMRST